MSYAVLLICSTVNCRKIVEEFGFQVHSTISEEKLGQVDIVEFINFQDITDFTRDMTG
jgi:hypothetical protein